MKKKKLLILGAGGHGRVAADIAIAMDAYESIIFASDDAAPPDFPYPHIGKCESAKAYLADYEIFVAIGNSAIRRRITEEFEALHANFATLIHPKAIIGSRVTFGAGTVVMPGVCVNADSKIGKGVILNTCCSVDHDCVLDDYVHIAPGARLCGTVYVGTDTWIGAGATVIHNISVCGGCMIASGAVVVKDVTISGTYKKVPAILSK